MRCPKCGFISFDSLDLCRKCNKPLGSVSVMLRGSACNCQAPVFLRFFKPTEEMETLDPLVNVIEEVEIEEPDLSAISKRASATMQSATSNNLSAIASPQPAMVSSDGQFAPLAWPEKEESAAFSADDKQTSGFAPVGTSMELPPDLADISDLAPPEQPVEFIEGEDDFNLDLDLDLGFDLRDVEEDDSEFEETVVGARKGEAGPVDMDSDLDFELDLGGLSLHDYGNNQK